MANIVLVVALLIIVGPLFLIVMTSLKSQAEIFTSPFALPQTLLVENYVRAWTVGDIPSRLWNSVVVTVASVTIATVAGSGAGYVCARVKPRWVGVALTAFFAFGLFIPVQSGIALLFSEMQLLGLIGTLWPMILINAATQLPLTVVIFAAFFAALPEEIEESAFVEGAGRIRVLFSIVLPMSRPVVATSVILGVVAVWNDFFVSLVFATSPKLQTLPVGLAAFSGTYATDWAATLAYSVILAAPLFIFYIVLQRQVLDGVTAGAVRG